MAQKMVKFTVEINEELAEGLAEFLKRVSYTDCRSNAVDDVEAYIIQDALDQVRESLKGVGYAPR
jgi:metal-responsive CopG/Arc/MetJ family transcriptional regulator